MGTESISRTFIGSVVCIDLIGYSTKSIAQQITIKEAFNRILAQALERVRPEDRIILDTGDGAAVSFLGDPESSLSVGVALRDAAAAQATQLGAARGEGPVRIGINLGPMKVALDLNGYPRIVGDGINVAERIAAFAQPGEIVVSRSFHDMVSRLSEANTALFTDGGTRADKNGREHQVFTVASANVVRAAAARAPRAAAPAPAAAASSGGALAGFLRDRLKVGFAATLLGVLIAVEVAVLVFGGGARERASVASAQTAAPAPVPARPVEPAAPPRAPPKGADPAPPAVVPPPAPAKPPEVAVPKAAESVPPKAADAAPPKPAEPAKPDPRAAAADAPKPAKRDEPKAAKRETPKAAIEPARPAPEPPKPAPEPPREEPKVAVAAPTTVATPVSKAPVNFPAAALARNIDRGQVKARLSIDATGQVRNVQILEAYPRRHFDEEATRSLKEWRFNPGADNRSYDVEIAFQR